MSAIAVIPAMTDPMGRNWEQPCPSRILIDDTHALMDRATFELLAEYSGTVPTGRYPGKMWRRDDGLFDPRCKPSERRWMLGWYGLSDKGPEWCSTNFREIIIV